MLEIFKYAIFFIICFIGIFGYDMCINNKNIFKLLNNNKYIVLFLTSIIMTFCIYVNNDSLNKKMFEKFAPTNYSMGKFSNLLLKPNGCSEWRRKPACNKLVSKIYTPQGNQLPLKPNFTEPINSGPPIDGNSEDDTRKDMFIFAYNKCSPDCCPSTFSCSNGCICTTKNQREYINQRGNNRTFSSINKKLKNIPKFSVNTSYIDA